MSRDREFWPDARCWRFERLLLDRVDVDSLAKASSASLSSDCDCPCVDRVGAVACCVGAGGGAFGREPGRGAWVGEIAIGSACAISAGGVGGDGVGVGSACGLPDGGFGRCGGGGGGGCVVGGGGGLRVASGDGACTGGGGG
ncbi:hypothetical protein KXR53_33650, partial [Inquilinus limosus]|uniref:hypothetical protein n=1 Tax=Inquilinus limosus TaxID=171674 RepID=UPI003F181F8B